MNADPALSGRLIDQETRYGATLAQLRELLNLKQGNSHDQLDENFH